MIVRHLIPAAWLAWALYWWIAARGTKATQWRESAASRLLHVAPLIAAFLLLSPTRMPNRSVTVVGIGAALTVAGLAFAVWARRHLGRNWSGTITLKVDHDLITSGPYRHVRHPIYSGLLLAFAGSAIATGGLRGVLAFFLAAFAIWRRVRLEEQVMRRQFGAVYEDYARHVGAVFPGIGLRRPCLALLRAKTRGMDSRFAAAAAILSMTRPSPKQVHAMTRSTAFSSFVYVANSDTQDLSVFGLRPDGELTALASVAVQRPVQLGRSMVLAPSPDRRPLYAAYLSGPDRPVVAAFAIAAATGSVERLGATPLPAASAYLSTDRTGRFLFSASFAGNKVTVNAIGPNGAVGEVLQVIPTEAKAHCIVADRSNRFVLHTSLGADLIYQRRFDPMTGRLSPNEPLSVSGRPHSGPRFIEFAPHAGVAYVINELDGAVDVLSYTEATGTLGPLVQTISTLPDGFTGKPWSADIHMHPDGRFLYVSERTSSVLGAFAIDRANGRLTRIGFYATARQPRAFGIDPAGAWLLAAGQLSDTVACHAIDANSGALTLQREYAVGKNPTWVEVLAP